MLRLTFEPEEADYAEATQEYRAVWAREGQRITEALVARSGLRFETDAVEVEVMEGPSWAGTTTIGMRASYPVATKQATLVHELGHILIGDLIPDNTPPGSAPEPHYILFLFLYDVWVDLWGLEFANEQVAVESSRRGIVDYEGTWQAVLSVTQEDRANQLRAIIAQWR